MVDRSGPVRSGPVRSVGVLFFSYFTVWVNLYVLSDHVLIIYFWFSLHTVILTNPSHLLFSLSIPFNHSNLSVCNMYVCLYVCLGACICVWITIYICVCGSALHTLYECFMCIIDVLRVFYKYCFNATFSAQMLYGIYCMLYLCCKYIVHTLILYMCRMCGQKQRRMTSLRWTWVRSVATATPALTTASWGRDRRRGTQRPSSASNSSRTRQPPCTSHNFQL